MYRWVRTPKHLLRMDALRYAIKKLSPGLFLECGAGTGDFTRCFLEAGFRGVVFDIDNRTLEILKRNLNEYENVTVVNNLEYLPKSKYDYLFAFEVLEHIADDNSTLSYWAEYLREKGIIVVSVPAGNKKFSKEDIRVGHIRRYERKELFDLLLENGFVDITIINYGFPLGNISRYGKNLFNALRTDCFHKGLSQADLSIDSGIERDLLEYKLKAVFNPKLIAPFACLQKWFFRFDFGDGYIAIAQKAPKFRRKY